MSVCVCGHSEEEHGHDPDYPGSTSCVYNREHGRRKKTRLNLEPGPCDCIAYEPAEDDGR